MSRDNSYYQAISVREAGRRGGLAVLATHGREHFSKIGKQGQKVLRDRYPGMAGVWGKKGGRPRKPNLEDMRDQGKTKKKEDADPPLSLDPPPPNYKQRGNEQQGLFLNIMKSRKCININRIT